MTKPCRLRKKEGCGQNSEEAQTSTACLQQGLDLESWGGEVFTCVWPPVSMLGGPWGRWGGEQQCGGDLGKRGVSGAERAPEVKGSEEGRGETSVAASRTLAWRVAACSPEEDVGWKGWLFLGEEIWACGKAGGKELVRGKLKTGKKDAWEVGRSDPGFRSFLMFYKKFKIFF